MAKLYLVRHGETLWNSEGRIQGHSNSPLTEAGITQAKLVGESLRAVDFAAAYSSDLGRTIETARHIVNGRSVGVQAVWELREKCYGDWESRSSHEISEAYPELYRQLVSDDADFAPPNGESDNDLVSRVSEFAKGISGAHADDENVLVVGHGGSLRALLVHYMKVPAKGMWNFVLSNGSLSILTTYAGGGALLERWNDVSHINFGD